MAFGSHFSMSLKDNLAKIRKERGLSQKALAAMIGVRQNTIAAIETGATKKTRYLADIARALSVDIADLDSDLAGPGQGAGAVRGMAGAREIDLFGSAQREGGALVLTSLPVDRISRPAPLANVRDGYALIVAGESMSPVIRPGDIVLVHPHLAPKIEDTCLFVRNERGTLHVRLAEYRGETKDHWKLRRYSPQEREFDLSKKDWERCHVILGKYSRR